MSISTHNIFQNENKVQKFLFKQNKFNEIYRSTNSQLKQKILFELLPLTKNQTPVVAI